MTADQSLESGSPVDVFESFLPGTPFGGVLGQSSELKVLDFLLGFPTKDFNISELAREADLSRPSARIVIRKMLDWGILESSRARAGSTYFKLNELSKHVAALREFIQATNELIIGQLTVSIESRESEIVSGGATSLVDYLSEIVRPSYAHVGTQTESTPPLELASAAPMSPEPPT